MRGAARQSKIAGRGGGEGERVPTSAHLSESNACHLATKRDHTAHTLALPLS